MFYYLWIISIIDYKLFIKNNSKTIKTINVKKAWMITLKNCANCEKVFRVSSELRKDVNIFHSIISLVEDHPCLNLSYPGECMENRGVCIQTLNFTIQKQDMWTK